VTSKQLFSDLRSAGVVLSIDRDGRLAFDGPDDVLTDDRLSVMRSHRDDLLALVERFEERAAVVQYDGGLPRPEAERLALADVLRPEPKEQVDTPEQYLFDTNSFQKNMKADAPEPLLCHRNSFQKNETDPVGVRCPYCPSRSYVDDPGGCRCCGCGRLAWITLPTGGIVRADYATVDL